MSQQPDTVSVIIPCYHQAEFLAEAIESVLVQSYPKHEIVVVDDGSPDHTGAVVKRYPTVRYVRQEKRGVSHARNRGLQETTGTYVVFLDADDWLLSNHFATALDAFRTHTKAAFVCGDFRMVGDDPTWRHVHRCDGQPDHYATLLRINFIGSLHAVMFRRDAVLNAGAFRTELKAAEDYDLLLRIARRHPIVCHHQPVAEYRRYGSQISKQWDLMLQSHMVVLRSQRSLFRGNPIYEQAYREGIERCRTNYGERALWQMVQSGRARNYRQAARQFRVLARWYPRGLARLFAGKMASTFLGRQAGHRA
jgi:glycosyltransferase involved in cell wall biosynthesis